MYYDKQLIDEVVSRNDIVDVISSYVGLKRAGSSYKCCCPFHTEKTPSFSVSRERQRYHCFGCGAGGNALTFVMKYDNMSYVEAIQYLAQRVGMELPERELSSEEKRQISRREKLFEINLEATNYFHYVLLHTENGKKGYEYYLKRGYTDETIKKFGLGYANIYRDDLYKYLKGKGYSDELMRDAGLVKFDEKYGPSDQFWNRVMVPIANINNRVIAFGGRVLGDAKPKYLNTKETDIFNKSRNLFAMNLAKNSRRKGFILCEGYMDVIAMHQAGFDNATASLGTAFTEGQANILKKYKSEIYLAYDSDDAGTRAAMKAISILRKLDMSQKVIDLRPYKDPDEFIKNEGAEAFEKRIQNAVNGRLFEINHISANYNMDDPEEKTKFMKAAGRLLAGIEDKTERANYIETVASKYFLDKDVLKSIVSDIGLAGLGESSLLVEEDTTETETRNDYNRAVQGNRNSAKENPAEENEKYLLTLMVNNQELFEKLTKYISKDDFTEEGVKDVAAMIFDEYEKNGKVELSLLLNDFEDVESQERVNSIFSKELDFDTSPSVMEKVLTDIIIKIKINNIDKKLTGEAGAGGGVNRIQLAKEKETVKKIKVKL